MRSSVQSEKVPLPIARGVLGVNLLGHSRGARLRPVNAKAEFCLSHCPHASIARLVVGTGSSSTFNGIKNSVVALLETLYYELAQRRSKIKGSVLFPGYVDTRIFDAERNQPLELRNACRR